ncbi:MAG: hypothetical protein DCC65_02335 [Planctomycetota bacterium]|nr:MAG: hypothetical protein DCC65_02335 [Planctomycetota bacterium]
MLRTGSFVPGNPLPLGNSIDAVVIWPRRKVVAVVTNRTARRVVAHEEQSGGRAERTLAAGPFDDH